MCRLFGQISVAPKSPRDFLSESQKSLLRLSYVNKKNMQKDGWGVGCFKGDLPEIVKSPEALFKEQRRFRSLASGISSRVVIGHIRAASNPRGLAHRRLIGMANSQPFTDGHLIFAHNGTLQIPDEVAKFLGAYRRRIRGLNDSEVYFWQFKKFYDAYHDVPEALKACIREDWSLWEGCKKRYPGKTAPYTGLNTLVSDGRSLHAMCHYKSAPKMRGIANPNQPWGTMSMARRGERLVVASENMDGGAWTRLAQSEIVSATIAKNSIDLRRQRFALGT